jgi:hypothetical protein
VKTKQKTKGEVKKGKNEQAKSAHVACLARAPSRKAATQDLSHTQTPSPTNLLLMGKND